MSLWGYHNLALNVYFLVYNIFHTNYEECLITTNHNLYASITLSTLTGISLSKEFISVPKGGSASNLNKTIKLKRVRADSRIGPHNKTILSIIFGTLLGDGYAEYRCKGNGTRIRFYQEGNHLAYLLYLHKLLADLGYCKSTIPKIQKRLGKKGVVKNILRFNSWTYSSLNWVQELWYVDGLKIVPSNIGEYLDPLALAIWIMDDGSKLGKGLKLSTNSFNYSDCLLLVKVLYDNFYLKATVQSAGNLKPQYHIYIWKESMPLLCDIVEPYVHSSMKYKLGK